MGKIKITLNKQKILHTFIFALGGVAFVWYVKSSDRIVKRNENGFLFHWGRVIFKFLIGLLETIFYHIFIVISIAVVKIYVLKNLTFVFYISKFINITFVSFRLPSSSSSVGLLELVSK